MKADYVSTKNSARKGQGCRSGGRGPCAFPAVILRDEGGGIYDLFE